MKVKYKEQEIDIPGNATIEVVNGDLIITPKYDFKDGDVLCELNGSYPFIFRGLNNHMNPKYYVGYSFNELLFPNMGSEGQWTSEWVRLATKEESKPLFDALADDGKRWNPETKRIEDIPKVGDICIFWDDDKEFAFISELSFLCNSGYPYKTNKNTTYKNAIKLYSIEQYKEFLKMKKQ